MRVSANVAALTEPDAGYAPGRVVEIHYNADNPAEAILNPSTRGLWLLWLLPAAILALAYVVGR